MLKEPNTNINKHITTATPTTTTERPKQDPLLKRKQNKKAKTFPTE